MPDRPSGSFAQLTSAGQARLDAILPGHLEVIERWFTSRFTQRQLTDLLTGLHVVRDAVRPDATAGVP